MIKRRTGRLEGFILIALRNSRSGMSLSDLVREAIRAGYEPGPDFDFTKTMLRAVGRLVRTNAVAKDTDTMRYSSVA